MCVMKVSSNFAPGRAALAFAFAFTSTVERKYFHILDGTSYALKSKLHHVG
jgi:hypothetical protein